MLMLSDVGEDESLWLKLVGSFGATSEELSKHRPIDLTRIPERAPLAGDAVLMSHVIRALIGSLHALTDEVETLKTLPRRTDENREKLEQLGDEVTALRGHASAQAESRKDRIILNVRARILRPALSAWSEVAATQRRARRLAALRLANPGLCRTWASWKAHVARKEANLASSLRCSEIACRFVERAVSQTLAGAWRLWGRYCAPREQRVRASVPHGWRILMSAVWRTWLRDVRATRLAARQRALEGTGSSAQAASPPDPAGAAASVQDAPPVRVAGRPPPPRPSSPPTRRPAASAGFLSVFGQSMAYREVALQRANALCVSEHNRASSLQARLAHSEARAAVLERRAVLRSKAAAGAATGAAAASSVHAHLRAKVAAEVASQASLLLRGDLGGDTAANGPREADEATASFKAIMAAMQLGQQAVPGPSATHPPPTTPVTCEEGESIALPTHSNLAGPVGPVLPVQPAGSSSASMCATIAASTAAPPSMASAASPRVRGPHHVQSARGRPGGSSAPAHRPAPPRPRAAANSTSLRSRAIQAASHTATPGASSTSHARAQPAASSGAAISSRVALTVGVAPWPGES